MFNAQLTNAILLVQFKKCMDYKSEEILYFSFNTSQREIGQYLNHDMLFLSL